MPWSQPFYSHRSSPACALLRGVRVVASAGDSVWRSSHWSSVEAAAGPSILAALLCALRHAADAPVNMATPVPVIVTDIARPAGEVSATVTQPFFCIRARFRLTVERSAISLVARAAGL